jgi:hypothetical protein
VIPFTCVLGFLVQHIFGSTFAELQCLDLFVIMQGALDGGLDIPHGEKRFAGFKKDEKQLDAEVHRKYIYGGHVAEYMRVKIAYALNITYIC